MQGNDVFGIIFSNTNDEALSEMTNVRTMGSIPFAARYRLIDFPLSSMVNANITKVKYGYSVQGRPLEAYVIENIKTGRYTKTLFMDFAVHGFEDAYFRDGQVLVNEANKLFCFSFG